MLKCTIFKRKLSLFLDGELTSIANKKMREHILNCTKCEKLFNLYSKLDYDIRQLINSKTENVVPYKEPYSEAVKRFECNEDNGKASILTTAKNFFEAEPIYNRDGSGICIKLLGTNNWIKALNVIFIVIGFLLLLATPIHGS